MKTTGCPGISVLVLTVSDPRAVMQAENAIEMSIEDVESPLDLTGGASSLLEQSLINPSK
jgi:hypothetical protein